MTTPRTFHVLAAVALAACRVGAAETYRNPVIDDNLADPVVIRHDDVEIEVAARGWQYTWNADAAGGRDR